MVRKETVTKTTVAAAFRPAMINSDNNGTASFGEDGDSPVAQQQQQLRWSVRSATVTPQEARHGNEEDEGRRWQLGNGGRRRSTVRLATSTVEKMMADSGGTAGHGFGLKKAVACGMEKRVRQRSAEEMRYERRRRRRHGVADGDGEDKVGTAGRWAGSVDDGDTEGEDTSIDGSVKDGGTAARQGRGVARGDEARTRDEHE